jgi:hypothetical protein
VFPDSNPYSGNHPQPECRAVASYSTSLPSHFSGAYELLSVFYLFWGGGLTADVKNDVRLFRVRDNFKPAPLSERFAARTHVRSFFAVVVIFLGGDVFSSSM